MKSREPSNTGGAATASGVEHENLNLAWAASYAVADVPLPIPRTSGLLVENVGAQSGMKVDDVGIITNRQGFVLLQAKKRLGLDTKPGSPLAKALDQVVDQYLSEVPDGSGREGATRALDSDRDLLVITTDLSAPATVRVHLADLIDTLATHPAALSLSAAAHNKKQQDALTALLAHLYASPHWKSRLGRTPDEADLRGLFRVLRLKVLGLEAGEPERAAAETYLTQVLVDPAQQGAAFEELARLALLHDVKQWWMSRADVLTWLRDRGFAVVGDRRMHVDIATLRTRSRNTWTTDITKAVIDTASGSPTLDRDIEPLLAGEIDNVVVVGAPGAGKTSVAAKLAKAEHDGGRDVLYLRAGDLTGTEADVKNALSLQHNLEYVLAGWMGPGQATLIIDGLDATRLAAPAGHLLDLLGRLPPRWRLVATARSFDLRNSSEWKRLFRGQPVDPSRADPQLASVKHLVVGELSAGEIGSLLSSHPELTPLFDPIRPRLAQLVRNPFNLSLAAGLVTDSSALLWTVRSQLDLLNLYWTERVAVGPQPQLRTAVLEKIAREMIRQRRDRLFRPQRVLDGDELAALNGLLRDGVVQEDTAASSLAPDASVAFSHALLFDFTTAALILAEPGRPMHVAEALDNQPNWSMLLRPSLDLHLAALWQSNQDRKDYFALATRLAADHPLAANAAAEIPLREHVTLRDLEPLADRCLDPVRLESRSTARRFTSQLLAGALHLPELRDSQLATAVPALAAIALQLALAAEDIVDLELAQTALVVVNRIRTLPGWQPDQPGAADCGMAAAAVTRTALATPDSPGHQHLAWRAADLLVDAVRIDPERHGPLIARYAEPAVMSAWGVSAAGVLTRNFRAIAAWAPGPSIQLAVAVWTFTEERDETTYLNLSQLHRYAGDRKQDLEGARHDIGAAFPALLTQNPDTAIELYLSIMGAVTPDRDEKPETGRPYVVDGGLLDQDGFGALASMTGELAEYLATQSQITTSTKEADRSSATDGSKDPLRERLVEIANRLTHDEAWSALLSAGARHAATLGRALLPLLGSGQLLTSDPTSRAAAELIQATAALLEDDEHHMLEVVITDMPTAGYSGHLRDRLLGALDRTRLVEPESTTRLAVLDANGGPPQVSTPPPSPFGRRMPPAEPIPPASPQLVDACQAVQAHLEAINSRDADQRSNALSDLTVSLPTLLARVRAHDPGGPGSKESEEHREARLVAVAAAAKLTEDPALAPDSPLGTTVLDILIDATAPPAGS